MPRNKDEIMMKEIDSQILEFGQYITGYLDLTIREPTVFIID